MTLDTRSTAILRFGTFEADLRAGELRKQGKRVKLQGQPFQVLAVLVQRPGDVVTREELRSQIWSADTFVDFDNSLNAAINKLREALGDSAENPRFIETLPRRGYRFLAYVTGEDWKASGTPPPQSPKGVRKTTVAILAGILVAIAACVLFIFFVRGHALQPAKAPILNSLAVLPLDNLTGDKSQEYFSDGMTDALITQLAQIPGLRVISRTSTIQYKGTKKSLPEIARELNVDAIVEGTVTRGGGNVKITAQLIYARGDAHLWAGSVTGSPDDVLKLQNELATKVTSKIEERRFTSSERLSPPKASTTSSEAYEEYLKGVFFYNRRTPEDIKTGIQHLQSVATRDPNFAPAYASLAYCYLFLGAYEELSFQEWYAPAQHFAERAMQLDSNLDEAYVAAAIVARGDWDWQKAQAEYRRAIQLNPNNAVAHLGYSQLLLILGRVDESANEERSARALDPISVDTKTVTIIDEYFRRQYEEGLVEVRAAVELYPQIPTLHVLLANLLAAQGNYELAAKEILVGEELGGATPERMAALRAADLTGGLKGLRRRRIELNKRLADQKSINSYDIAIDCAAVGDNIEALNWLEKSLQVNDQKVSLIGLEPIFDDLHKSPRFLAILNHVGLKAVQF